MLSNSVSAAFTVYMSHFCSLSLQICAPLAKRHSHDIINTLFRPLFIETDLTMHIFIYLDPKTLKGPDLHVSTPSSTMAELAIVLLTYSD